MNRTVVRTNVFVDACNLNEHYMSHILEKIRNKDKITCTRKDGYILGIEGDIQIIDNEIATSACGVFFIVEYKVMSLKPNIGDVFEGRVCMVFDKGVFVEVENCMKVLIPSDKMSNYKYSKSKNCFKSSANTLAENTTVKIQIVSTKYEKQNYNCIGIIRI
jgi:DNA-directed RNA polymerase subunit E'/Rpb7